MAFENLRATFTHPRGWLFDLFTRGHIPPTPLMIVISCLIGVAGGYGAVAFTYLIEFVTEVAVVPVLELPQTHPQWASFAAILLVFVPALGLLAVSWFTRRFAPEAQGHGVPEVIAAVARHDGIIRPRVALIKILASGACIGTGGSIGREGPIVQIGSALGSMAGQWTGLSPRHIKVLVAAGAAAGISATFNAPLAGVIFASEIIIGSFAVEALTPIVIASVLADVVQTHSGEHGLDPAFPHIYHSYQGAWEQIPSYMMLGIVCGLAAVGFTKLLYWLEDFSERAIPKWWLRALVCGGVVGVAGAFYPMLPPNVSNGHQAEEGLAQPPLFGVGYGVVAHALHLENVKKPTLRTDLSAAEKRRSEEQIVPLDAEAMLAQLWWLLPLALLKPLMTSLTLAGGGSGGIFAPSLFIGATLGACFGLVANLLFPGVSANPGVYAVVGMGAVVSGTTHGTLSAILIVYEMTDDYNIILPIMIAAGLAGIVARAIDPESIYEKKLSRRGELVARGHEMHKLEHVMVRNVMIRDFPHVKNTDNVLEIIRVAKDNSHIESLPVMDADGKLVGIIRSADLHRVLDSDISPYLLNADDVALSTKATVRPDSNLLEALREFGASDVETLPVEIRSGEARRLVGLLLRSDAMRRYREEMLRTR